MSRRTSTRSAKRRANDAGMTSVAESFRRRKTNSGVHQVKKDLLSENRAQRIDLITDTPSKEPVAASVETPHAPAVPHEKEVSVPHEKEVNVSPTAPAKPAKKRLGFNSVDIQETSDGEEFVFDWGDGKILNEPEVEEETPVKDVAPEVQFDRVVDNEDYVSPFAPETIPLENVVLAANKEFLEKTRPLPKKYLNLLDIAAGIEAAFLAFNARKQLPAWCYLKPAAEQASRRNVSLKEFQQICFLAPDLYHVERSFIDENKPRWHPEQFTVRQRQIEVEGKIQNDYTARKARLRVLYEAIMRYANINHEEFLSKKNLSLPKNERSWHPKYNIDALPSIPQHHFFEEDSNKKNIAGELKKQEEELIKKRTERDNAVDTAGEAFQKLEAGLSKEMKSIPRHIVEKVMRRQVAAADEKNTLSDKEKDRVALLGRLPKFFSAISSVFTMAGKPSLPRKILENKLKTQSRVVVSEEEVAENLKELMSVIPDVLTETTIPKVGSFIRLQAGAGGLKSAMDRLQAAYEGAKAGMPPQ